LLTAHETALGKQLTDALAEECAQLVLEHRVAKAAAQAM
jgi:hypothetical protein